MNLSSYLGATTNTSDYNGRGTGLILLDDVGCTGTESRLLDCHSAGVGVSNCDHSGHAGVSCQSRSCANDYSHEDAYSVFVYTLSLALLSVLCAIIILSLSKKIGVGMLTQRKYNHAK